MVESRAKDDFFDNLRKHSHAIELCLGNKLVMPALMLLYAGIDVVAALERKTGEGTKASFVRWADSYIIKNCHLRCSALDLYGARCGLLHTMAAESDLSRKGNTREIIYAWGTTSLKNLEETCQALGITQQFVAVHVSDLVDAYNRGIIDYLQELETNEARFKTVRSNAGIWIQNLPDPILGAFLDQYRKSGEA